MKSWHFTLLAFLMFNCHHQETQFPDTPYIEVRDIKVISSKDQSLPDTISTTLYVRDGNFDLGLDDFSTTDTSAPFNYSYFFLKSSGEPVAEQDPNFNIDKYISYKDKRSHLIDTLPAFVAPYSCTRWFVFSLPSRDTIYYRKNLNYYNLIVDFYYLENNDWKLFDFEKVLSNYPNCFPGIGFNARFPKPFGKSGSFISVQQSNQEMVLTYKMGSVGFRPTFGTKKIKLKLKIKDRALNVSNEIETPEFSFN